MLHIAALGGRGSRFDEVSGAETQVPPQENLQCARSKDQFQFLMNGTCHYTIHVSASVYVCVCVCMFCCDNWFSVDQ